MNDSTVHRRFATAALHALGAPAEGAAATRVGEFTLREAQERALQAVLRALDGLGGALLADPPGTGKTVIALAVAARASSTLVVAPAALREQWLGAAARAGLSIDFFSLESLSRGAYPGRTALVIVDEAHHVRTPGTRRYQRLAKLALGARTLLLTATPVVNRPRDRAALLALFLGRHADEPLADRCVIRADVDADRPAVRQLGVIGRGVEVRGVADAIASLPPPLPVEEGSAATALVRMTLAMAWRSSIAALDAALRRRIQRGEALRDLLWAGATPSRAALRTFVLDEGSTQLALILDDVEPSVTPQAPEMLAVLERHLDAVRALRGLLAAHRSEDARRRADALRALAALAHDRRIVVFARHAETIRALHQALRGEPGVVAIVGSRVLAAAGRWTRDEVLRAVGPRAKPLRPDDPRAIRLLLATDVVAEGVEMQGVGIVIHADLPWTPARLEQRVGRVTRVGSAQREVLVGRFGAPRGARLLIALGRRLQRKQDARRSALRESRAREAMLAELRRWCELPSRPSARDVAMPAGQVDRFVALTRTGDEAHLIAGTRRHRRWRVSSRPGRITHVLRDARAPRVHLHDAVDDPVLRRLVLRVLARRAARDALGAARTVDAARIHRIRRRLARLLEHAPALARREIAARQADLLAMLERPIEAERERRIDELLREEPRDDAFARKLGALLARDDRAPNGTSRPGLPGRLEQLVAYAVSAARPAAVPPRARSSASPGSAAPR